MEWQPIKTAPKDGTRILFWQNGRKIKMGEWIAPRLGYPFHGWKCTNGNFHQPTHWAPIPAPPKQD